MEQDDMKEKPDEKSQEENMCQIINDTIQSKGDEVSFIGELRNLLKDGSKVENELNELTSDSNKYVNILKTIKEKTGCCNGKTG